MPTVRVLRVRIVVCVRDKIVVLIFRLRRHHMFREAVEVYTYP